MPIDCACDACGKAYRLKDALAGMQGRCSGCGGVFRIPTPPAPAPVPPDAFDLDEPAPARAAALPPRAGAGDDDPPTARATARRKRPRNREWTDGERGVFGFGVKLVIFGVLALLLPYVGLQFRVFRHGNATTAGTAIILIGVVVMLLVQVKRRPLLTLQCAGAAILSLFLLSFTLRAVFRPRPPQAPPAMPGGPAFAGPPPGMPMPPPPPAGFPAPPWEGGGGAAPGVEPLEQRFGAGKVAVLRITGDVPGGAEIRLRPKLRALCDPGGNNASSSSRRGGALVIAIGPVSDLDACAARVDFGRVTRVDPASRTIEVEANPGALDPRG